MILECIVTSLDQHDTLNIAPMAQSRAERVEQVAKLRSLVDSL